MKEGTSTPHGHMQELTLADAISTTLQTGYVSCLDLPCIDCLFPLFAVVFLFIIGVNLIIIYLSWIHAS